MRWPGHPTGADCAGCHSGLRDNSIAVTNFDGLINLNDVNLATATDRGLLKYYEVVRGTTLTLSFDVLDGSNNYAISLNGFDTGGVMNNVSNKLIYTPDSTWFAQTDGDTGLAYYTMDAGDGDSGIDWGGATTSYTFDLFVDGATPLDTYELQVGIGGRRTPTPRSWFDNEFFYVRVVDAVPEPASWVMFSGLGICTVWYWRRRKATRAANS